MKIRVSELRRLINEVVEQRLTEDVDASTQTDFYRQQLEGWLLPVFGEGSIPPIDLVSQGTEIDTLSPKFKVRMDMDTSDAMVNAMEDAFDEAQNAGVISWHTEGPDYVVEFHDTEGIDKDIAYDYVGMGRSPGGSSVW